MVPWHTITIWLAPHNLAQMLETLDLMATEMRPPVQNA
jgi:hypothetical protein